MEEFSQHTKNYLIPQWLRGKESTSNADQTHQVWFLAQENSLEKEMATHSNNIA